MRSRYTAFALELGDYLLASWHPTTRPESIGFEPGIRWRRLDVLRTEAGGPFDREGAVEFEAHYRLEGARGVQHEVGAFLRERGRWYYLGAR